MKYVYVVIGNSTSIFVEQAWLSIWSLVYYNPDAQIYIITDEETMAFLDNYSELKKIVKNFYPIHFDKDVLQMARSRWLKTKMREIIKGDFVYIDSDTIITGDLTGLKSGYSDIGMVLDMHIPYDNHIYKNLVSKLFKKVYGVSPESSAYYYNGGFMCCKDTKISHEFFKRWHNNWKECRKKGINIDQISLFRTSLEMPEAVLPISGIYNCQLTYSIQYLHEARIMHFQRMNKRKGKPISPFYEDEIYYQLRDAKFVNEELQRAVLNCKSLIMSPSIPLTFEEFHLFQSKLFRFLSLFVR